MFFFFRQGTGMNDENGSIVVNQIYHLQKSPSPSTTPNQEFFLLIPNWERLPRLSNDPFSFFGLNSVYRDMFNIPFVPTKFHERIPNRYLLILSNALVR